MPFKDKTTEILSIGIVAAFVAGMAVAIFALNTDSPFFKQAEQAKDVLTYKPVLINTNEIDKSKITGTIVSTTHSGNMTTFTLNNNMNFNLPDEKNIIEQGKTIEIELIRSSPICLGAIVFENQTAIINPYVIASMNLTHYTIKSEQTQECNPDNIYLTVSGWKIK